MIYRTFATLSTSVVFAAIAAAGTYNQVLSVGDPAPAWTDLPGVDGKKHALADFQGKPALVVVFTCCSCPAAEDYEDKIVAFAKKHADKVGVVAINVNTIKEDRLDKMKVRAEAKHFTFPFLYDASQKIAKRFGAQYTPEFFVLDKERKVVYMGAMDDRDPPAVAKMHFVEDAVTAALNNQKAAIGETLGRGCRIRYLRKRGE
ncbi:MAG TPA: thioredoxin family protein [Gemmataceae bacterium]|nr:thioredoxin family protein [Gemmataceae bacterium]